MLTNAARPGKSKDGKRLKAERRLAALVRNGLESPQEPADPGYWNKRRQALRRVITKKPR
jgi:hypothetical protein